MYLRRAPAALPGVVRHRVLRAENDAGPAATCLHCAACVPACPTGANHEFAGDDARLIVTDDASCIGCGACVEVCPANRVNGGQTLRVVEAPTQQALAALDALVTGTAQ
jgi:Fe-S-cluster-containing hydrogenase component 2